MSVELKKEKEEMRKIKTVLLLVAMTSLFLMVQGGISASAASGSDTVDVSVTYYQTQARSMLSMINNFRKSDDAWYWNEDNETKTTCSGLSELTYDYNLEKVAMQRAVEIALYFSHTRPSNKTCWTAYSEANYSYGYAGENIAYGSYYSTADYPFYAWQETDADYDGQGHRRNMLSSNFNVCAVACVYYNGIYYWVQEFASTTKSSSETQANDSATDVSVEISSDIISSLSLTVSTDSIALSEGDSISLPTLTAKILFTDTSRTVTVYPSCTWQVGDTSILSVSGDVLTATGVGTTKLTTSFLGESVQVSVTVSKDLSKCSMDLGTTSYTYDGSAKEPSVTVKDGSTTLTKGTDYTVSYSNNTNAGTATVTVSGNGNYTGTLSKTFTISAASISEASLTLSSYSYTYDGSAKQPSATVKNGSTTLGSSDYSVSYSNNTNAGTATVTVTGSGNYTGTLTATFTISAADISKMTITLSPDSYTYDGTAKEPTATVKNGSTVLTSGTDYTVSYSNNTDIGTATVTVTGKGNYTGTLSKNFTISEADISNMTLTLSSDNYTYDGTAKEPTVTIKNGGTSLESDNYTVSYSNNTNAGTATVTATGSGIYTGTLSATFTINPASISGATVTLSASSYTYDGSAKKPTVTNVKNGGKTLTSGTDYSVSYSNNTNAGTATVTVTGKGNYNKTATKNFTIKKASQTLTAKAASTTIVKGKTTTITASGKGTISYSSSNKSIATVSSKGKITAKAPGTAKITVKAAGNGNYNSASKTLTIKVNPRATTLKSAKSSSSKKMTVKWKKVSGVTGYQIQYSTNKNFKSGNKTVKVSGASKVSKTISKLKKGKTYYVRVRTYKKVSGTTYYSSWTSKKKVKVK